MSAIFYWVYSFFVGPLYVFYYFAYKNYLRLGESVAYALFWAPVASTFTVLCGAAFWFIKPLELLCYAAKQNIRLLSNIDTFAVFLVFVFLSALLLVSLIKRNQDQILSNFRLLKCPDQALLVILGVAFAVPLALIEVSFGKYHFGLATSLAVTYYTVFYFVFFRRIFAKILLNKDERSQSLR
ncbi:MAG TPA: hypothetical protein VMA74_12035 [Dyella sp.]|uniref:hypothetical protein n=1 Tax=Dyella sp. TaxID=1869338 RepID=UPI002D1134D9|nr:hypothetical protein [Dyella sp.]HUB90445.1 hypothetical protein [Dyella sp.]